MEGKRKKAEKRKRRAESDYVPEKGGLVYVQNDVEGKGKNESMDITRKEECTTNDCGRAA